MKDDERQYVLRELRQAREFIEKNWSDDLGRQFTAWVLQTESNLERVEICSESFNSRISAIRAQCQEAFSWFDGSSDDSPKVLRLEHKPPRL